MRWLQLEWVELRRWLVEASEQPGERVRQVQATQLIKQSVRHFSTRGCLLIAHATLVLLLAGCSDSSSTAAPTTMSFATGSPNGIYYPYGGGLSSIWSRTLDGVNIKAEVTGASMINVIQVARGESEVGIAMGDVVTSAYRGEGRFPEALPIRTLFAAYPNFFHLVALADSGITRVQDLKGKRVSMGAPGSGTAVAAENVLAGLGISQTQVQAQYLNFTGTADGLKDGVLDAAFVVGGLGIGVVKELALTRDVVLIGFSPAEVATLNAQHPAYVEEQIPAGAYRGVTEDVLTLSTWNLVVVNQNMDDDLAWRLLCSLYQHQPELQQIVASASFSVPANAARMPAVPLHSGAQRFLADAQAQDVANMDCGI